MDDNGDAGLIMKIRQAVPVNCLCSRISNFALRNCILTKKETQIKLNVLLKHLKRELAVTLLKNLILAAKENAKS